jgi:hypothetical protein
MSKTILKDGMKVRMPRGARHFGNLTPGKLYTVSNVGHFGTYTCFDIEFDNGNTRFCLLEGCGHIGMKNWIIVK